MDPITAALAVGAAAGLTSVASQAVQDAYRRLKAALNARFPDLGVHVQALEARPESQSKQSSLAEELADAGAERDTDLMRLAQALLQAVQREAPEAAVRAGVDLERVRAGRSVVIENAEGPDVGVRGRDWEVTGDIRISGARGHRGSDSKRPNSVDMVQSPASPTDRPIANLHQVEAGRDVLLAGRDIIHVAGEPATRALPPEPRAGIPPDLTENFVGRQAELVELRRQLLSHRRVVIQGLGGVGKTQLAVRYLHQYRDAYRDGCFWVRAEDATTLVGDLASLSWRIELPERDEYEHERQIEAVLRWLQQHPSWLLVVDNLEQPVLEAVRHWLPPGLPGHVLITSRMRPRVSVRIGLEPLPRPLAVGFLLARTGQNDTAAAHAVAEALGGLPLALEQAAAYIEVTGRSLASYAALLRTRMSALLREGKPDDYPHTVATTWSLSFARLQREHPASADLLRLCAFLAPDDLPTAVLAEGASELPEHLRESLTDEVGSDRIMTALRGYSLVQFQDSALRVHRLIQWVVRESLTREEQVGWLSAAIRLLSAAMPGEVRHPDTWPLCARLLTHVQTIVGLLGDQELEPRAMVRLLDRLAFYLMIRADHTTAQGLFERALLICERALGPKHVDTARILHHLGRLLQSQGELTAARPLLERAIAIREEALGPEHVETADSMRYLGTLLKDMNQLVAARTLHERALAIYQKTRGPEHPDTARGLNELAIVLHFQGQVHAARRLHERSLAITEKALGHDHPETAISLHNLAWILHELGELAAARQMYERAVAIHEKVDGPEHPATARCLDNLAELLKDLGDLAGARPLYERALAIIEGALGPEHLDTATVLNDFAALLWAQGDMADAQSRYQRALAIRERALGPDHADTASSLHDLAALLQAQGELSAARQLYERALVIREKALGTGHRATVRTRQALDSLPPPVSN